ncbi:hypothetical protein Tco_0300065 [Tanacetum coccineum]
MDLNLDEKLIGSDEESGRIIISGAVKFLNPVESGKESDPIGFFFKVRLETFAKRGPAVPWERGSEDQFKMKRENNLTHSFQQDHAVVKCCIVVP